jgi:hypothetical protein
VRSPEVYIKCVTDGRDYYVTSNGGYIKTIDQYSDMFSSILDGIVSNAFEDSTNKDNGLMNLQDAYAKVHEKINKANAKAQEKINKATRQQLKQQKTSSVDNYKLPILPKQLWSFCEAMQSKYASAKLYEKICDLAEAVNQNTVFVTKIGYYIDSETTDPYLVVSSLSGKESFKQMAGDLEQFVNKAKDDSYKVHLFKLDNELTQQELELLCKYNDYCQKKISKDEAKSLATVRYKIGDVLILKSKIRDGSKRNYRKFVVKKIIWSINSNPVNIIIVKQVSGPITNMSLSKNDCKRYHIKYEENLQVYSMMMNFVKIVDKQ